MDLDRLEKLCREASKAPWEAKTNRHPQCNGEPWGWISGAQENTTWSGRVGRINAEFIAEARTALPLLIERVRKLEAMYDDIDMTPEQVAQLVDHKATEVENIFLRKESIQVSLENIELKKRVREAEKVCNAMQKLRAAASELRDSTHNNERVIYRTKLDIAEAEMWQALAEWEKDKEECQHGDIRD